MWLSTGWMLSQLVSGSGRLDVLALAAVALRRHDHAAGDPGRHGGAELATHEVQAGVDAGGGAGAGDDRAVVDVEDVHGRPRSRGKRRANSSA